MSVIRDNEKEKMLEAYNDVRKDDSDTNWCCMKYESGELVFESSGIEFEDLKTKFGEDERAFAFLRVIGGDEMSKRRKFVFMSWVGPSVSALKKAKMSTEKAYVKQIFSSFAVELQFDDLKEVKEELVKAEVAKAGGANYGVGH